MNTLRPLRGYCIVEPDAQTPANISGIWTPEQKQDEKGNVGTVIAYTPGFNERRDPLQPGQRVAMQRGWGRQFDYAGKTYISFPNDQLEAIVEGAAKVEMDGVPRCRFCRTTKDGANALVLGGTCVICGRDKRGLVPEETPRQAHAKLNERLRKKAMERGTAKGNVFGYRKG